ncbi:MAG: avidin/streptavidin family protein, partial [Gammaproteobacteria bacterium]|nr:avidin/streptavidin family protein [Gammaproteobacteria bacterium]
YFSRKGRAVSGLEYPITGRQNGELVAFHVDWRDPRSNLHAITSFTGRCTIDTEGREAIHTVWVLARQFEDEACEKPTGVWNSFLTNSDVFLRENMD